MKRMRKNNKGFSLVELIIVIAIMVALIAVMGPQYVKYVQSSRDAVVGDAAESVLSVVKSEYAMNNLQGAGSITISALTGNGEVVLAFDGVTAGPNAASGYDFLKICGVDTTKKVKSDVVYTIAITDGGAGGMAFSMSKTGDLVTESGNITVA